MTLSDHELMLRSRLGDAAAFAELVRRWESPIGRVVARLLGTTAEVDDVCQEVFLRVLRAKDRYQPSGAFSTCQSSSPRSRPNTLMPSAWPFQTVPRTPTRETGPSCEATSEE